MSSSSPTLGVLTLPRRCVNDYFLPSIQKCVLAISLKKQTTHVYSFFSFGHRLPPGCDRQLHSFFCGGWGLPSCREWSSHHSAPLLLLSSYLQVPGPCNRGTGYQSLPAQGTAGRGLNSKKGTVRPSQPELGSSRSSPTPSWCPQNHSALSILICLLP